MNGRQALYFKNIIWHKTNKKNDNRVEKEKYERQLCVDVGLPWRSQSALSVRQFSCDISKQASPLFKQRHGKKQGYIHGKNVQLKPAMGEL